MKFSATLPDIGMAYRYEQSSMTLREVWLHNSGVTPKAWNYQDAEWTLARIHDGGFQEDAPPISDQYRTWVDFHENLQREVDYLLNKYEPERKDKVYAMAYAVEFVIQKLTEQAEMAKTLEMNKKPGGGYDSLLEKLKGQVNLSAEIPVLKVVNGGARKYAQHCGDAIEKLEPLRAVWLEVMAVRAMTYESGEQREKAIARLKGKAEQIESACKAAIADCKKALDLLEQGERAQQIVSK